MTDFVPRGSIGRRIWGDGDVVLLVFAGSAAEFALNRAVDWLFFAGKLPNDRIGRLFATAGYAQQIVFADDLTASATLGTARSYISQRSACSTRHPSTSPPLAS
jgi:hypothetical protein